MTNASITTKRTAAVFSGELLACAHCRGATVRPEYLWTYLYQEKPFSLFLTYPKSEFTDDASGPIRQANAAHSRLHAM